MDCAGVVANPRITRLLRKGIARSNAQKRSCEYEGCEFSTIWDNSYTAHVKKVHNERSDSLPMHSGYL